MVCEAKEGVGFYRPRQPQETPFYKLVKRFYPKFERVYEERYRERTGFWRPTCPPKPPPSVAGYCGGRVGAGGSSPGPFHAVHSPE